MTTLNSNLYEFTEGGYSASVDPEEYVIEFKPCDTVTNLVTSDSNLSFIASAGPVYDGTIECGTIIANDVIHCKESLMGNSAHFRYTYSDVVAAQSMEVYNTIDMQNGSIFQMGYNSRFMINGQDITPRLADLHHTAYTVDNMNSRLYELERQMDDLEHTTSRLEYLERKLNELDGFVEYHIEGRGR